jgi:hypothetical protein
MGLFSRFCVRPLDSTPTHPAPGQLPPNNLGALPPRIAIFCLSESVVVANPCLDPLPQAGRLTRRLILHFIGNHIANLDMEGQSFSE